jgi:hypothetical protein
MTGEQLHRPAPTDVHEVVRGRMLPETDFGALARKVSLKIYALTVI